VREEAGQPLLPCPLAKGHAGRVSRLHKKQQLLPGFLGLVEETSAATAGHPGRTVQVS
jgi:hypothetical protein